MEFVVPVGAEEAEGVVELGAGLVETEGGLAGVGPEALSLSSLTFEARFITMLFSEEVHRRLKALLLRDRGMSACQRHRVL